MPRIQFLFMIDFLSKHWKEEKSLSKQIYHHSSKQFVNSQDKSCRELDIKPFEGYHVLYITMGF